MERTEMESHIREHVQYPATKQDLVQACSMMSHVPEADREWFSDQLPDGTYSTPDEVIKKLEM